MNEATEPVDPILRAVLSQVAQRKYDHENHACGLNCDFCEEETQADEAPGGQCYEGECCHDDCIRERSEATMAAYQYIIIAKPYASF